MHIHNVLYSRFKNGKKILSYMCVRWWWFYLDVMHLVMVASRIMLLTIISFLFHHGNKNISSSYCFFVFVENKSWTYFFFVLPLKLSFMYLFRYTKNFFSKCVKEDMEVVTKEEKKTKEKLYFRLKGEQKKKTFENVIKEDFMRNIKVNFYFSIYIRNESGKISPTQFFFFILLTYDLKWETFSSLALSHSTNLSISHKNIFLIFFLFSVSEVTHILTNTIESFFFFYLQEKQKKLKLQLV